MLTYAHSNLNHNQTHPIKSISFQYLFSSSSFAFVEDESYSPLPHSQTFLLFIPFILQWSALMRHHHSSHPFHHLIISCCVVFWATQNEKSMCTNLDWCGWLHALQSNASLFFLFKIYIYFVVVVDCRCWLCGVIDEVTAWRMDWLHSSMLIRTKTTNPSFSQNLQKKNSFPSWT